MIAVIQRVSRASVSVDGTVKGECKKGLCILLGVARGDTKEDVDAITHKILNLRVFEDGNGRMNLSLLDEKGQMLVVSNFTLLASYKKGNRPDYMGAASPAEANELYEYFADCCQCFVPTGRGVFGADMKVDIEGDGPVTIVLDSKNLTKGKSIL